MIWIHIWLACKLCVQVSGGVTQAYASRGPSLDVGSEVIWEFMATMDLVQLTHTRVTHWIWWLVWVSDVI